MTLRRLTHDLQRNIKLKHANLLPLLGITQGFGPLPAIVSPWMKNGSLTMLLQRDFQQITLPRKLQILKDVASALQYLHGDLTGVSTTDISFKTIIDATQNNILINETRNTFVADHGILVCCAELNGTSYIRSNVRWAAPELFEVPEDEKSINPPQMASDIYSFRCIISQVFTGKVPYSEFRDDHEVTVQILRGRKPARPMTSSITDTLWDFTQKCWLDKSEQRPSANGVLTFIQGQLEESSCSHATRDATAVS
ncbi:kinase-like domain-containing protein [Suillus plorans]|uniref:Kinase-like domain-containing protein n=1 Tax=Suillus plorans TaxID=116603 RepID=A0A9P7A9M0_9AGAM|nr:kinase-like domain-containing protein [Suillus plorans]KAG1784974.1 kinase-like domain-containing protein [Suillus plorans]